MITCNTIMNAINNIGENQIDVKLTFSYMSSELRLEFFKTSNYPNILIALDDNSIEDINLASSYKGALYQRIKSQANGIFFSINEKTVLAIKSYLEKLGCTVDYQRVARLPR